MLTAEQCKCKLNEFADPEKAAFLPHFFKTKPGDYGEGDQFIGITVPNIRKVVKHCYKEINRAEVEKLMNDTVHEYRFAALLILIHQFEKASSVQDQENIIAFYLRNIDTVNNWDLVDLSAPKLLGPYLTDKDKKLLYDFSYSNTLWKQRIAILTTFHFIRLNQFDDTLKIAAILLNHPHDLIHKAVGWMLREIGNRDFETEFKFLKVHYKSMPRTMLRYAIEKFDTKLRDQFLKGTV